MLSQGPAGVAGTAPACPCLSVQPPGNQFALLFLAWCYEQIPGDPKLLVSRFEPEKLAEFFITSIEQQPRRELLLPADVGVTIRQAYTAHSWWLATVMVGAAEGRLGCCAQQDPAAGTAVVLAEGDHQQPAGCVLQRRTALATNNCEHSHLVNSCSWFQKLQIFSIAGLRSGDGEGDECVLEFVQVFVSASASPQQENTFGMAGFCTPCDSGFGLG